LFSYSGLSREQVRRLREEYSLYAIDSGRISIAIINSRNVAYISRAIGRVLVWIGWRIRTKRPRALGGRFLRSSSWAILVAGDYCLTSSISQVYSMIPSNQQRGFQN